MEKKRFQCHISGTKSIPQSSQIVTSSGIPSLDHILGGGIPVGSVVLLEEDTYGSYSRFMLKYFVAEGVVGKHTCFIASQDMDSRGFMQEMPAVIKSNCQEMPSNRIEDEDNMKIAFRYQHLPTKETGKLNSIGHFYDLTKNMSDEDITNADVICWPNERLIPDYNNGFLDGMYSRLLKSIANMVKNEKFLLDNTSENKSILRIAIHSLGSPMWLSENLCNKNDRTESNSTLIKFLYCLRALIQNTLAVAVITIPSHLFNTFTIERCVHCSDISLKLKAFVGTKLETNKSLLDYHGFFYLTKLATVNSIATKHPGSVEYAFKLRRRNFTIEKLHLPPDFEDDNNQKKKSTSGCCGTSNSVLDF